MPRRNAQKAAKTKSSVARRREDDAKAVTETTRVTLDSYAMAGVPLAKEFIDRIRTEDPDKPSWLTEKGSNSLRPEQALILRARYLGSDLVGRRLVQSGNIKVFVERAAGMYPLGFNVTRDLPVPYIETDISGEFMSKPEICDKVAKDLKVKPRGTLLFAKMDGITLKGREAVETLLRRYDGPIGFIDAGLMIYQEEMVFRGGYIEAAKRMLMCRKGSVWIATDISIRTREFVEGMSELDPQYMGFFKRIKKRLGVDYKRFPANWSEMANFLEHKGLEVRQCTPADLGYDLWFPKLAESSMPAALLERYMAYISTNFRTVTLRLRK